MTSLENLVDPACEVVETGKYQDFSREQYQYWWVDDFGNRFLIVTQNFYHPYGLAWELFESAITEYHQLLNMYRQGLIEDFIPGYQEEINDEEGEVIDTYFNKFGVH